MSDFKKGDVVKLVSKEMGESRGSSAEIGALYHIFAIDDDGDVWMRSREGTNTSRHCVNPADLHIVAADEIEDENNATDSTPSRSSFADKPSSYGIW